MNYLPVSTYRIQLNPEFRFKDLEKLLDYLEDLGVKDVYTSPYLRPIPGSTHGYDIIDHNDLNSELGSEADYFDLTASIQRRKMGHILDMVPNHMGISRSMNIFWQDVLENGPSAESSEFFDIEWTPPKPALKNKVLLPILGDQYGQVLERGEIQLFREKGCFGIQYFDHRLPLAPKSLVPFLQQVVTASQIDPSDPQLQELQSIITALGHLPPASSTQGEHRIERAREKEVIKRRLENLCEKAPVFQRFIDNLIGIYNGEPGNPSSFDLLDGMLREQHYRLSYWRVATEEINYRRFFDINELAALRMEDPKVFETAHRLISRYIGDGRINGLRLDHTDGLYDPLNYFRKLQMLRQKQLAGSPGDSAIYEERLKSEWVPNLPRPLFIVVEKILETEENIPRRWPIHGTTGYDFLSQVNGLWVDPDAEQDLTKTYTHFTGEKADYEDLLYASKQLIMRSSLSSEVAMLAHQLANIAENNRRSRDFTMASLTNAIIETISCFSVYRVYVQEDGSREERDDFYIEMAAQKAIFRNPAINVSIFKFLRDILLLKFPNNATEEQRKEQIRFVLKFQQVTSPVVAKGVEDTAFYIFNRLVSLNEVGSSPNEFGTTAERFHRGNEERLTNWPYSFLATSSHDTKRGEDARTRICVLSEMPEKWHEFLIEASRIGRTKKKTIDGVSAPSRNDEYLFYQTLIGAFPIDGNLERFMERMRSYMSKATKEAKVHTSWINPKIEYDEAVADFVEKMLSDKKFLKALTEFDETLVTFGACNSLAQTLLKCTSPGVPDIYQGSELWNQNLVDPDNRRPVDFEQRKRFLFRIEKGSSDRAFLSRDLLENFRNGAIKMYVIQMALKARNQFPDVFGEGNYFPIQESKHIIGFSRFCKKKEFVTLVPRFPYLLTKGKQKWPLGEVWGDQIMTFPSVAEYLNLFTGRVIHAKGPIPLSRIFEIFPVALFERK